MTCPENLVLDAVHEHPKTQVEFSSTMPDEGSPETRARLTPHKAFERKFFNDEFSFTADVEDEFGRRITDRWTNEIWTFEAREGDDGAGRFDLFPLDRHFFPAPPIAVREGDLVHCTVQPSKSVHTIHWHGIEPLPRNDGVGHTSFEVNGSYTYQWQPGVGNAGTYFYHCHVNTTLHVQMGMFGGLIVDPPEGAGVAFSTGDPLTEPRYDVEAVWAAYAVDEAWHELNHAAGLDGENVGLNLFAPQHVCLVGQVATIVNQNGVRKRVLQRVPQERVGATDVRVRAKAGQTILLRLISASYLPIEVTFARKIRDAAGNPATGSPLPVSVIASDGRPFADALLGAGPPRRLTPGEYPQRTKLPMSPAERYDCLLTINEPGTYETRVDFYDWIQPGTFEHARRAATQATPIRGPVSPRRAAFTTITIDP